MCVAIAFGYRPVTTDLEKEDLATDCIPFVMDISIFKERKESLATKIDI